jgi:hypothetical protein
MYIVQDYSVLYYNAARLLYVRVGILLTFVYLQNCKTTQFPHYYILVDQYGISSEFQIHVEMSSI